MTNKMKEDPARNWDQDFGHENGWYQNLCAFCGHLFYGHKRRVCCRLCSIDPMEPR